MLIIQQASTPYNGTYDGNSHNVITNISANPSDSKIEYSIDGTNFSTTMPTITNTSLILFQMEYITKYLFNQVDIKKYI